MDKTLEELIKSNDLGQEETRESIVKCFVEAANEQKKLSEHIKTLERQLEIQDKVITNLQNENTQLQLDKAELEIKLDIDEEDEGDEEDIEDIIEKNLEDILWTL